MVVSTDLSQLLRPDEERDMMLEAVENRFAATRAPHAIEDLSDNGSAYTARDTRLFVSGKETPSGGSGAE